MFDYLKASKNKEEGKYNKIKYNIEQTGKNDVSEELRDLCIDRYNANKEVLKKFRRDLHFKFFLKYEIPLIALGIGSYFILTSPKGSKVVPVYNLEQTVICDNKMISTTDTNNYIVNPYSDVPLDEKYFEIDKIRNTIQYQVKNGTRNVIITLNLSDTGEFEVTDSLVSNFFDLNSNVFNDIDPTDLEPKYEELVEDISNYILEVSKTGGDSFNAAKKEIKRLLEDQKTTVITSINQYYQIDELTIDESVSTYRLKQIGAEIGIIIAALLISLAMLYIFDARQIEGVYEDGTSLRRNSSYSAKVNLFKTMRDAKRAFVIADDRRKNKIRKLAKENLSGNSREIFEK